MSSGPIIALILEGGNCIALARQTLGATDPLVALPGTIRGDLAGSMGMNMVHASDGVDGSRREIGIWFPEVEGEI